MESHIEKNPLGGADRIVVELEPGHKLVVGSSAKGKHPVSDAFGAGMGILSQTMKDFSLDAPAWQFVYYGKMAGGCLSCDSDQEKRLAVYVLHAGSSEDNRRYVSSLTNAVIYCVKEPLRNEQLSEIMQRHGVAGIFIDAWYREPDIEKQREVGRDRR